MKEGIWKTDDLGFEMKVYAHEETNATRALALF